MALAKAITLDGVNAKYLKAARRRLKDNLKEGAPAAGLEGRCLLWQGAVNTAGYGQFGFKGRNLGAHRAALLLEQGHLEAGRVVRHLCHNKLCCNPAHLQEGTYAENAADLKAQREMERALLPPTPEEVAACEEFWDLVLGAA